MKANDAPERIWIDPATDLPKLSGHIDKNSVEYVRTDAFIEKACFYIKNMVLDMTYSDIDGKDNYNIDEFIEDFRKYMGGE